MFFQDSGGLLFHYINLTAKYIIYSACCNFSLLINNDGSSTMKTLFFMLCMIGSILLLTIAVPVSALGAPSISSINPAYAYNGASVKGVVITGTGLNVTSSLGKVRLMMDGKSNITATVTAYSTTSLTCTFPISGVSAGEWDVVVINRDGQEDVLSGGFTIKSAITLTSVSPASAQTNSSVTVTVVGTGLSDIESMYLYNADYDNITADITSQTSIKVLGRFNLNNADTDTYDICVVDSTNTIKCGLNFEIVSDQVGSIEVTSSPYGAKVYLDSTYKGTTPLTLDDVSLGSHKILISNTGYDDWSKVVTVKAGTSIIVNADLNEVQTTATTRVPTVAPSQTSLKANTVKVPTPWPTATTQASPLEVTVVLGAIALGFVVLHRR